MHLKNLGFILLLACVSSVKAQSILNLDMEVKDVSTGLPKGWFGSSATRTHQLKIDSSSKLSGEYALALSNTNNNSTAYATYAIKANHSAKVLKLTGSIRTENVTEGYAGLFIHIKADKTFKNNWLQQVNMEGTGLSGTTSWSTFSIEAPYDETMADSIYVGAELFGSGTVWLDNFSIELDGVDIASLPAKAKAEVAAVKDTAFSYSSGISKISLTDATTDALTNLGMIWGFIKYHHPGVAQGKFNMDAELFRVLPSVIAAKDKSTANKIMEDWVDKFGKPAKCTNCIEIKKLEKTRQMPDYGRLFDQNNLSASLIEKLAFIRDNRNTAVSHYLAMGVPAAPKPDFRNERTYASVKNPDAGLRLLGLYRYWNAVQYFYANKYLLDEDWNKALPAFIPQFVNAKDSVEYLNAAARLVAKVNDSDAGIFSALFNRMAGAYYPPVQTKFIGDDLVVTGYYLNDDQLKRNIQPGDIIRKVNNRAVADLIKERLALVSASNKETGLRNIRPLLLRDKINTTSWEIERDGKVVKVEVELQPGSNLNFSIDKDPAPAEAAYKLLKGNVGYINAFKLKNEELDNVQEAFKNSNGLIIDYRGFSAAAIANSMVPWIKTSSTPFVAYSYPNIGAPGYFTITDQKSIGRKNEEPYKGNVVVIVNEQTQGPSEFAIMALQSAGATVVGSTTAGADANVSPIYLPGDIVTNISGVGVYYPDGKETQKGLRIDVVVKPTVAAVKQGRDEQLEKALEVVQKGRL